uniref:Ribonuclease A-domain domain-containing protein n=1 Tax=Seriola lalandi dorsalis TaxID=1841481 RepID=A0A3B4WT12_SERLL
RETRVTFSCLLLVLLSAAQCSEGATYEDFKDKHIRRKEDIKDCKEMMENMKDRKINTFIIDSEENIKQVCKDGTFIRQDKPHNSDIYESKKVFDLFDCEQGHDKYPDKRMPARIRIACRKGLPVHFEKYP